MSRRYKLLIGFSTGVLHKSGMSLLSRLSLMSQLGCKAVELNYIRYNEFLDANFARMTKILQNRNNF